MRIVTHMDSKKNIEAIKKKGWVHIRTTGDHWHFHHPEQAEIVADQDNLDAIAFFIVSVPEIKSKTVRVNITLPEDILHQIDVTARKRGM